MLIDPIKFSCTLDLKEHENVLTALELHETLCNEHHRPICMFSFNVSVLEPSESSTVIWLRDVDEQAELGAVRYFIERLCGVIALTGTWGFEYSCNSFTNLVPEFGGGVMLFDLNSGDVVKWHSTDEWMEMALQDPSTVPTPATI
ncbi:MAG: hypothetical protein RKE52_04540 [Marinovum algicola]|jgi:hypothetical protein|uniref:hypothetical protein n=1 Tax=Marinovum algicola TaxID=42444 RepID=UPI0032EFE7E4